MKQIYGKARTKILTKELKELENDTISTRNKELITEFQNYLFSRQSGNLRVAKLSFQLRTMCRWLEKALNIPRNLDELTKKDAVTLISFINKQQEKAEATKSDYRRTLKQFFNWFKDDDTRLYEADIEARMDAKKFYNYLEKDVSSSYKRNQADPSTILTDEDIQQVIENGAKTTRDKAFIGLLHETGCRASEFLNLKIGDVVLKENHIELHIPDGKTGKRVIYATKSIPHLLRYLDVHPFKSNNNSDLWVSDANKSKGETLMHRGGQKLIDQCFKRANLSKKHNWHWFRHSRATILAPKMSEVMLCKYMGWVLGSKQIKTYVHLCNKQLEDVYLNINGLKNKDEKKNEPVKCVCGTLNNAKDRYCFKCFRPLNVETVMRDKELINGEVNKTIQFFMEMAKDPELLKKFEEFKRGSK